MNIVGQLRAPHPPSSASPAVVQSSAIGRFVITTLKDIKIQNFSSQNNNDPSSETVQYLEEKHVFNTSEAQWSEPLFELVVHPNGHSADTKDFVSVLIRKFWFRPYFVPNMTSDFLRCTVSVLDINGRQRFLQSFVKEGFLAPGWGLDVFNADDVGLGKFLSCSTLIDEADELLPLDVLTVRYEVSFEYSVGDVRIVFDPFKKGIRIAKTPLSDKLMYFKSVLSMMENALDEINYVLQLQGTLKNMFLEGKFKCGEMITPVSDGWEETFGTMYHFSLMGKRQTNISACYGGWMNGGNLKELSSDQHLELSKVSAEIERRCDRTVQLAEIKLLLFNLMMNNNQVEEDEINNETKTIMEMFSIHKIVLNMLVDNKQVKNREASHQDKETDNTKQLIFFAILFLSHLIKIMRLLSRNVCIATSLLNNCNFFVPKPAVTFREEETSSEETQIKDSIKAVYQEKVETECEKTVKNYKVETWSKELRNQEKADYPRIMVDEEGTCNDEAVGDRNIETKTREGKHMESLIEKSAIEEKNEKERELKLQNEEMQNQEVEDWEERNESVANVAYDDEIVGNQKKADYPRIMVDEEGTCNEAVDRNIQTKTREGKHIESLIEKSAIEEKNEKERELKLQNEEMQNQEVEDWEERNESVANVAYDDEIVGNQKEAAVKSKKINVIKLVENEKAGFQTEVKGRYEESENSKENNEREAEDLWQLISQTRDCNGYFSEANSLMVEGCLLKASSPVFDRMMETCMQEQLNRQIRLDVGFETLKLFVNYLKTGELADSDGYDWKLLYEIAHQYDIQRLVQMCSEQIAQNITIENSFLLEQFAECYQDDQLRVKLKKFMEECDGLWEKWKIPSTSISPSSLTNPTKSEDAKKESKIQDYEFYQ